MNGPFCSNCGASVDGMRFCTSCGAPVTAPEPDPYDYLFADPSESAPRSEGPQATPQPQTEFPTAIRPAVPASAVGPPRRSAGWAWVAAAAVLLAAVVAAGVTLTLGHHRTAADGDPGPSTPTGAGSSPRAGGTPGSSTSPAPSSTSSSTSSSAPSAGGVHAPARVASQVRTLLAQEVAAHQADNAAVGALLTCTHIAANRQTVSSFAATRRRLTSRLAAVPSSSSPRLDSVVHRLLGTWRSLTPIDRAYASWAAAVRHGRHACHAPTAPGTSQASKDRRHQLRDDWAALLRSHAQWHVAQVGALSDSGRHGLAYLLL